jgi:hypothetical protein
VLVVHDAACGVCAGIVRDLPQLLRVPVRMRSCRDPELYVAYPDLPPAARACRAPAVGLVHPDGTVCWRLGLRAAPSLLRVLRPRCLPGAVRIFVTLVTAQR